ncbi:hypothetical protein CRENBAI_016964, partial [Crenichthys baileyi]
FLGVAPASLLGASEKRSGAVEGQGEVVERLLSRLLEPLWYRSRKVTRVFC